MYWLNKTGKRTSLAIPFYQSLHFSGRTIGDPSGQLKDRWKSSELDTGPITLYTVRSCTCDKMRKFV
jgi:hypothetical protein